MTHVSCQAGFASLTGRQYPPYRASVHPELVRMKFREDQMSITSQTRSTAYAVMQRIFEEGFATGDGSVADELCSPDLLDHQFGTAGCGADAIAHVRDAMRDVHGAFPDIKFTIEDAVESGDTIWVRVRGQGTATGPFFGPPGGPPARPPAGRPVGRAAGRDRPAGRVAGGSCLARCARAATMVRGAFGSTG